jgi:tetratricopeptide (TPR) repeat protein
VIQRASERKIDVIQLSLCRYFVSFLKGDKAAMEGEITYRTATFHAQDHFAHQEAVTLAAQGRLKEAARRWDQALVLARQGRFLERAAMFEGARAVWNAMFGLRGEARKKSAEALSLFRSRDADYAPALTLALLGQSDRAHKIGADLEKRFPEYTSLKFSYLPVLRGLECIHRGEPQKAFEMTQPAATYEFAVPGTAYYSGSFLGALFPVYVRGLALSQMGRHREAAAEFQKIVEHRGLTLNDPVGPMARLQLARALSASGDRAKSAAVYKDLLSLWKDADPDVPAVQEARAELSQIMKRL